MNKDLLSEKYGRYYEIPYRLSTNGHHIDMLLLAYRKEQDRSYRQSDSLGWESINKNLGKYIGRARKIIRNDGVDLIVGSADMQFCILAEWLGRVHGVPVICDIYDNFDAYASANIPFLSGFYYRSLKRVSGNVVFTEILRDYLETKAPNDAYHVVPNSVDENVFRPLDMGECRTRLNLPQNRQLIGYFGAIAHSRGIDVAFRAFSRLRDQGLDVELVMAGLCDKGVELPSQGVRFLGQLAHDQIPSLINACDANVICYKDDAFSRYSFPFKAAEYIACRRPFVAPDVGGIVKFLDHHQEYLYKVGDDQDLAKKLGGLLGRSSFNFPVIGSWDDMARDYSRIIDQTISQ